jgi:hypothetical protein
MNWEPAKAYLPSAYQDKKVDVVLKGWNAKTDAFTYERRCNVIFTKYGWSHHHLNGWRQHFTGFLIVAYRDIPPLAPGGPWISGSPEKGGVYDILVKQWNPETDTFQHERRTDITYDADGLHFDKSSWAVVGWMAVPEYAPEDLIRED